jgi:hypothetical protein
MCFLMANVASSPTTCARVHPTRGTLDPRSIPSFLWKKSSNVITKHFALSSFVVLLLLLNHKVPAVLETRILLPLPLKIFDGKKGAVALSVNPVKVSW